MKYVQSYKRLPGGPEDIIFVRLLLQKERLVLHSLHVIAASYTEAVLHAANPRFKYRFCR